MKWTLLSNLACGLPTVMARTLPSDLFIIPPERLAEQSCLIGILTASLVGLYLTTLIVDLADETAVYPPASVRGRGPRDVVIDILS